MGVGLCVCCVCAQGRGCNAGWGKPTPDISPPLSPGSSGAAAGSGPGTVMGVTDLTFTYLNTDSPTSLGKLLECVPNEMKRNHGKFQKSKCLWFLGKLHFHLAHMV